MPQPRLIERQLLPVAASVTTSCSKRSPGGGMGIVHRARQVSLNRVVAVKLMRDSALAGVDEVRRFRVEAAAAAKLKHPHIVALHEVGEQEGQHFFAMDLVEGGNLAQRTRQGPLAPQAAAALVAKIADAVQHAHERGALHRDLKPSNVLLDAEGQPFVTDFGLARTLEGDSSLTMTGQVLGTPGYMPPEQAAGQGTVGPAAAIYSLGALMRLILCRRHAPENREEVHRPRETAPGCGEAH